MNHFRSQTNTKQIRRGDAPALIGLTMMGAIPAHAQISFVEYDDYPTVSDASGVAAAEMTGDGLIDLVSLEEFGTIRILAGQSDGGFARYIESRIPALEAGRFRVGDVDHNGTEDLVWTDTTGVHIYFTVPGPTWGKMLTVHADDAPAQDVQIGDMDDDGDMEVLIVDRNRLRMYRNQGGRTFEPSMVRPFAEPEGQAVTLGDIDGDGDLDLAALSVDEDYYYTYSYKVYSATVEVLLNRGTGLFETGAIIDLPLSDDQLFPKELALGDFDGDRDLDVVISTTHYQSSQFDPEIQFVEILDGGRASNFRTLYTTGGTYFRQPVITADVDLDGDVDAILSESGRFAVYRNDGDFTFQSIPFEYLGARPITAFDLLDANHDGVLDLVTSFERGIVVHTNMTPFPGPQLEVPPLRRGEPTELRVTDAPVGETAYCLYRLGEPATSAGRFALGGKVIEVGDDFRSLGMAVVASDGTASFALDVPPNAPRKLITFQAVIPTDRPGDNSLKSTVQTRRIE